MTQVMNTDQRLQFESARGVNVTRHKSLKSTTLVFNQLHVLLLFLPCYAQDVAFTGMMDSFLSGVEDALQDQLLPQKKKNHANHKSSSMPLNSAVHDRKNHLLTGELVCLQKSSKPPWPQKRLSEGWRNPSPFLEVLVHASPEWLFQLSEELCFREGTFSKYFFL